LKICVSFCAIMKIFTPEILIENDTGISDIPGHGVKGLPLASQFEKYTIIGVNI
jgi:hypothetical protein